MGVAAKRAFISGAAIDEVEDGSRRAPPGKPSEIRDVDGPGQTPCCRASEGARWGEHRGELAYMGEPPGSLPVDSSLGSDVFDHGTSFANTTPSVE